VTNLKNIVVSTDRKTLIVEFSTPPSCFMKAPNSKSSCDNFHQLNVLRMSTLQIFCTSELSVDLVRVIYAEHEQHKDKMARSSQRKRARTACEECDCCEYYQEELKAAQKARVEADKKREAQEKELECVNTTGMTADFERDFYTPVVYNSHRLQSEISEIKRMITYEQWMGVPTRPMGLFDPEVLARANINDEIASLLQRETLMDPNFTSSNKPLLEKIRRKYGEEVLQDALRCREEIDTYNASAGHPVLIPWDYEEDRELKPSESVRIMINKSRELSHKHEDLERRHTELLVQHEELQQRIKHMRLENKAPLATNTYHVPEPEEEDLPVENKEAGRACVIM